MTVGDGEAAFETLIYTDCRAGQGLRGTVGLQFQARSPEADETAMSVVQRNLLYEPPANWMRERRPVDEYPPSFAHTWDGHLATAAGVYLGKEATGSREGNQLTHSIVTRDPQSYGLVRPAQLFQAPFWTTQPAPTTDCPPIAVGWEPGPFDAEQAKKFVTDQADGPEMLVALLSALEQVDQAQARRILFLAEQPEPVLRWLTAATLLLPQRKALTIGFKVFTTNPAYATQPVVAVHPDWDATPARVDNDLGYVVFDLVRGAWSAVEPTDDARRWVDLFCAEDPYDVVDVIELAAASTLPPEEAPLLGRAAVLRERLTDDSAKVLVRWLRDSPADLLAAHRGTIVDLLADGVDRWPQQVLLDLDEVSRSGQVPRDRMAPVRLALITAEIQRAHREAEVVNVALPPLPHGIWLPEHQRAAEQAVVEAVETAAAPEAFDAVLRVASRFGLPVRIGEIKDAAQRFVLEWVRHPRRRYELSAWPCGQDLDDMLVDELSDRIQRDPEQAPAIGDQWWEARLPGLREVNTPLDRAVVGAAILHLDPAGRREWVDAFLRQALDSGQPRLRITEAVNVLWSRAVPMFDELDHLRRVVPKGSDLDQRIFYRLVREMQSGRLTDEMLALAHALVAQQLMRPVATVMELLSADRLLHDLRRKLARLKPDEDPDPEVVESLRRIPGRLLILRRAELVTTLLRLDRPPLVLGMLSAVPADVFTCYSGRLVRELRDVGTAEMATTAFYLSITSTVPRPAREGFTRAVMRWLNTVSPKQIKQATERTSAIDATCAKAWEKRVAEARGGNVATRLMRRRGR